MKLKTIFAVLSILIISALVAPQVSADQPQKQTVVFTVEPKMHCQNCENKIKTNLRFEKGVLDISTDVKSNTVTITYDTRKTDVTKLEAAFKKIGYTASEQKKE